MLMSTFSELPILNFVLQGQHILHLYVFPESRAQFLKLLGQAGLLPELNIGLGIGFGSTEIDFWSYASGLSDVLGEDMRNKTPVLGEKALTVVSSPLKSSRSF